MKQPLRPMRAALVIALASVVACTTIDPDVPASFDLTGTWQLVSDLSDEAPDVDAIRRREDQRIARGRQTDPSASGAFVAEDFPIVAASRLVIEQDRRSMGVRYGDGVYRDFTWGDRQRDFWRIRSGWRDDALVIDSERGDIKALEQLSLSRDGRRLMVVVTIRTGGEDFRGTRIFEKVDG